jgi:hypothetical protein
MDGRIGNFATDIPMKDMAMVVAPVAMVVYFICFPGPARLHPGVARAAR